MNTLLNPTKRLAFLLILAAFSIGATEASAHCDTMNGPVVLDARKALETGSVAPVLKWVTPGDEAEVMDAFNRTMRARTVHADVQEMADLYFFETVVRLHRMSEGVGYTGLKPATAVAPSIAAADHALETGSVEELAHLLIENLRATLEARFADAYEARGHADHNVEAGRAFVEAYVRFTHLAEAIDQVILHTSEAHTGSAHAPGHAAH